MEPVTNVISVAVAALISISQNYSDGISEYQKTNYDRSCTAFTKVIESKERPNPLRDVSLFMRSQIYLQQNKTNEAVADLKIFLEASSSGQLFKAASADYKKLTGTDWDWVKQTTPEETWASICKAIKKHDRTNLMRCISGEARDSLIEQFGDDEQSWEGLSVVTNAKVLNVRYSEDKSRALLCMLMEGEENNQLMEKLEGIWMLTSDSYSDDNEEFGKPAESVKVSIADVPVTPEEEKDIDSLVLKLGSKDSKVRKNAYEKLRGYGAKAGKILEKAKSNNDPEISEQAKKLLTLISADAP